MRMYGGHSSSSGRFLYFRGSGNGHWIGKSDINAALVAAITQANRAVHDCKFFLCE